MTQLELLEKLQAEHAQLQARIEQLEKNLEESQKNLAKIDNHRQNLIAENIDLREAMSQMQAEQKAQLQLIEQLETENAKLKKQLADPAYLVNAGGPPTPPNQSEAQTKSPDELLQEYRSITDARARAEFRARYAKELGIKND